MASEVDICNLALGYLGDSATVSSLHPAEGSAQADHCRKFYPMARDELLEMHAWGFSTKRATLALLGSSWPEWQYCYAAPNDAVNFLAVLPPDATDDYSTGNSVGNVSYTPQSYSVEAGDDGSTVVYTNQVDAVLRYTAMVTDPTQFSPLFTGALAWLLASKLAGPLLKGESGAAAAKSCYKMFRVLFGQASVSDANQRRIQPQQHVAWMTGR